MPRRSTTLSVSEGRASVPITPTRPTTRGHAAVTTPLSLRQVRKGAGSSKRSRGRVAKKASHRPGVASPGVPSLTRRITRMSSAQKNPERSTRGYGDKSDRSRKTTKRPSSEKIAKAPPTKVSKVTEPKRVTTARPKRTARAGPRQSEDSSSGKIGTDKKRVRALSKGSKPRITKATTRVVANQKTGGSVSPQAKTTTKQAKKSSTEATAKSKVKTSAKRQTTKLQGRGMRGKDTTAEKATSVKGTGKGKTKKLPVAKGSKRQKVTVTKTKKIAVIKRIKLQREQKATVSKTKKITVPKRKQAKATMTKIKKTTVAKKISQRRAPASKTQKTTVVKKRKQQKASVSMTKKTIITKRKTQKKVMTSKTKKKTVTQNNKQEKQTVVKTTKTINAIKRNKGAKHPNSKLSPNPTIKEVTKDPMFEVRNEKEIPKISDYVDSKRAIRALLTKDNSLLKKLIANTKEIPSLFIKRSVCLQDDALDYALKTENLGALKMLIKEKYNEDATRRKPMPSLPDLSEFTGYSRSIEGNKALTKDVDNVSEIRNIIRFEKALIQGVSLEVVKLLKEGSGYDCAGLIYHAVRAGHHQLAEQMMKTFRGRRGNGFIKLHQEVLIAKKPEQLTSFKAELVTKESFKNQRMTPLHCAAINPKPKILAKLLSVSPDISLRDQAGFSPIHYAAACVTSDPLELLLKSGADGDEPQPKKLVTPLMIAAKYGRAQNLQVLLKKIKPPKTSDPAQTKRDKVGVERKDRKGHYAIHYAAEGGHVDCVSILIKHGAAVEAKESSKNYMITPLMIASERGHFQLAKVLIEELGAEIEKRDKFKRTSLMLACMNGHYPVATLLLRKGANPNAKDSSGNTPVHYAAAYGWWHCLKLLLQAGADPNIFNTNMDYNTPLSPLGAAYMKGHTGCLKLLLNHPRVDVDCRDKGGTTLLLTACNKPMTEDSMSLIRLLLDFGADINAAEKHIRTPYKLAIENGNADLLKMFLAEDPGMPLEADLSGSNPLHWMAMRCEDVWPEILQLLVNNEKAWASKPRAKDGTRRQKNTGSKVMTLQKAAQMKDRKGCTPFLRCIIAHSSWKWCRGSENIRCRAWYATLKALIHLCKSDINAVTGEDQKDVPGNSCALHILAKRPSDAFSMIMDLKPQLDVVNSEGYTPLLCAIEDRQTANAKILTHNLETILSELLQNHAAALTGILWSILSQLAAGADPNGSDRHSALLLAVKQNLPDVIPQLIAKGADVHGSVFENQQPSIMHYLTEYMSKEPGSQVSAAKELVSAGASLTAVDDNDRTVLHSAVNMMESDGSTEFLQFLLDQNLDALAVDKAGSLPLHYAFFKYEAFDHKAPAVIKEGNLYYIVPMLVTAMEGKHLNVRNTAGNTPLHGAAGAGDMFSVRYIAERIDDLNIRNMHGYTPLSMAVLHSKQWVAEWFFWRGADFNLRLVLENERKARPSEEITTSIFQKIVHKDWQGIVKIVMDKIAKGQVTWMSYLDALEVILSEGRYQLAEELIRKLPEPLTLQSTNDKGQNLLHLMAIHVEGGGDMQDKIVLFLLDNGVKLFETDQKGCTPLHYAAVNMNVAFCDIFAKRDPTGFESCITCADHRSRVPITSLFWGLLYNQNVVEVVELILKHNGSLDVCAAFPNVSLLSMKQLTRSESLLDWYHDLPEDKTIQVTPLIFMILMNNFAGCQLLLKNGGDPNARDRNGMTPLMYAAKQSEIPLVRLLMDHAYDPEKAGMKKMEKPKPAWGQVVEEEDKLPWTTSPWRRRESGSTMWIDLLFGYEEDDSETMHGFFHVQTQPQEITSYGLTSSLDVNAVDLLGRTAVHHLMKTCDYGTYENVELLQLLARVGAKLSEKDHQGKTPLDYTMESGSHKMAAALQKLTGVDPPITKPSKLATPAWLVGIVFDSPKPDVDSDAKAMVEILEAETIQAKDLKRKEDDKSGLRHFLMDEDINIQYKATLTKVEIQKKKVCHRFHIIELVELFNNTVDLCSYWGNIHGALNSDERYFLKKEDAISEFKEIFKTQTGNDWENIQRFETKPNKFSLIEWSPWGAKENTASQDFQFDLASPVPSKLPEEIQCVLREWTKPEVLKAAIEETRINTSIMNFGNLSKEVLQEASDVLDKISTSIEKECEEKRQGLLDRKKSLIYAKERYHLSNHYLHDLIPIKNFRPEKAYPIVNSSGVEDQRKRLLDLRELEMINRILMGAMYRKQEMNPLDYIYHALDCKLKLMDEDDVEMQHILQYIHHASGSVEYEVQAVFRMSRDGEDEQLESCHLDNHKLLWHGCNAANLLSTMKLGLQARHCNDTSSYDLKEYIHLTPSFKRAVYDGRLFGQEDARFVFLLEVALGKMAVNPLSRLWPESCDSAYKPNCNRINKNRELLLQTGCLLPVGRLHRPASYFTFQSWYLVATRKQACLRYLVQLKGDK